MQAHPDFQNSNIPRAAEIGPFRLTALSPAEVDEDFAVVTESSGVLLGLFGDTWPRDLTLEENLSDLVRHDQEFAAKKAFSWIIRSSKGEYLGCAYLYPTLGRQGEGRVYTWIRQRPDRLVLIDQFNALFRQWLIGYLPSGYQMAWTSNGK